MNVLVSKVTFEPIQKGYLMTIMALKDLQRLLDKIINLPHNWKYEDFMDIVDLQFNILNASVREDLDDEYEPRVGKALLKIWKKVQEVEGLDSKQYRLLVQCDHLARVITNFCNVKRVLEWDEGFRVLFLEVMKERNYNQLLDIPLRKVSMEIITFFGQQLQEKNLDDPEAVSLRDIGFKIMISPGFGKLPKKAAHTLTEIVKQNYAISGSVDVFNPDTSSAPRHMRKVFGSSSQDRNQDKVIKEKEEEIKKLINALTKLNNENKNLKKNLDKKDTQLKRLTRGQNLSKNKKLDKTLVTDVKLVKSQPLRHTFSQKTFEPSPRSQEIDKKNSKSSLSQTCSDTRPTPVTPIILTKVSNGYQAASRKKTLYKSRSCSQPCSGSSGDSTNQSLDADMDTLSIDENPSTQTSMTQSSDGTQESGHFYMDVPSSEEDNSQTIQKDTGDSEEMEQHTAEQADQNCTNGNSSSGSQEDSENMKKRKMIGLDWKGMMHDVCGSASQGAIAAEVEITSHDFPIDWLPSQTDVPLDAFINNQNPFDYADTIGPRTQRRKARPKQFPVKLSSSN
jgi:hypothetical protein